MHQFVSPGGLNPRLSVMADRHTVLAAHYFAGRYCGSTGSREIASYQSCGTFGGDHNDGDGRSRRLATTESWHLERLGQS